MRILESFNFKIQSFVIISIIFTFHFAIYETTESSSHWVTNFIVISPSFTTKKALNEPITIVHILNPADV